MKEITVKQLSQKTGELLKIAQHERVVVTRQGKPMAVLVGIENKDEEDLSWERDEAFWRMIRNRRKERIIPLPEIKDKLGLGEPKSRKRKGR